MMEFVNSMRGEPNYHGSLERLPLAPVRGKPPPYASRRQQSSRRGGVLKSLRGLSSSTGDLTSSSRSRSNSSTSNEGDWEDWSGRGGGGGGSAGDLGIPLNPRDVSEPPTTTPAQPHHQRHGSVTYSYVDLTSDDKNSDRNPSNERSALTATSTPQPHHQRHGSVTYSYVDLTSDDRNSDHNPSHERSALTTPPTQPQHQRHGSVTYSNVEQASNTRNSDRNPSHEHSTPTATPAYPHHQHQGSVSYNYLGATSEPSDAGRKTNDNTQSSNTSQAQHRHSGREGREQATRSNKTQQEEKQGSRNTNDNRSEERAKARAGDASDSDTASPASTLERRQRSGSMGNSNSLKNYRELAAIPDHTLVKWNRSKSMSDVFTEDDDAKDFEDKDGTNEGKRRRAASYSDMKDTVDKEAKDKDKMKHRERYKETKDADKDARRHIPSYKDAKDATDKERRSKNETRHTVKSPSLRSRSEGQEVKDAGSKDGGIHVARPILVRGKDEYQVDYVKEEEVTMQRAHHVVLSPSSSSSSSSSPSPSSISNTPLTRQSDRGSGGEGVFVATPVFLEDSPTSSPPPPAPPSSSSAAHQESRDNGAGEDLLKREKDTALSTLRREILHLTRLKEEIEENLIKSQVELKKQVSGLREERGGLEAVMEERERRLQAQGEEIKDLKGTIAQLQILVFASDGEVRLQRKTSDLLEQLREEKRHRLEERKELQREVRALTSRLQEKEAQLQKYKSDPALSSWGSGGLGRLEKGAIGTWKTSLPDVRREPSPNSFSTSLAEKRRSSSSLSDSSDDSHSTVRSYRAVESLEKPNITPVKDSWTSEKFNKAPLEGRPRGGNVRLDKPVDSSGKSYIAPVSDSRVNRASARRDTAATPSGKSDKVPVRGRPRESYVGLDKPVDSFRKSYIAPVSDSRVNEAPTRPSGKLNKAPLGEGRPRSTPVWPDKAVEVSKKSDIATVDSAPHSVPLRLDRPWESSGHANRRPTSRTDPDVDCSVPTKSSVVTLDLAPTSLTAPLGDMLSNTVDGQRYGGDGSGKTRVRTTVYLQLGDYTGSGGGREGGYDSGLGEGEYGRALKEGGGRDGDYRRSGDFGRGLREGGGGDGDYRRSGDFDRGLREGGGRDGDYDRGLRERGGGDGDYRWSGDFDRGLRERGGTDKDYRRSGIYERGLGEGDYMHSRGYDGGLKEGDYGKPAGSNGDYLGSENYEREPKQTSQNLVGKSTTPLVHLHHLHHTGQLPQPHILRPNAPPPPPPQNTTSTSRLHNAPPPPRITREQFRERPPQPPTQVRLRGQEVRSGGDVEVEAGSRTSWMYKPVEGSGEGPAEERWRREKVENGRGGDYGKRNNAEKERGVEYGRREREPARGVDNGRSKDQELPRGVEGGRRETGAERGMEYGRRTNLNPPNAKEGGRRGTESPREVEDWKNQASELPRSNSILSSVSEAGKGILATSYITATIHCLHNIAPLRHFFTEEFRALGVRSEVARAVSGVFGALETGRGDREAIQHLRDAVGHRDKIFLLHQDPPAADFLPCLLAWLHSDLTPERHPQGPPASSVVSRLFHGLRESLIVCPTRGEVLSVAMESFNFLTLSVPGEGAWTLQELLVRRFQPQEMAWQCGLCGRRHPCSHQPHLLQPPRVLVLYLRRPSSGAAAARVLFPEGGLTLQLHHQHQQHREARTFRSSEFQLAGVVTREGGEGGSVSHHSAFYRDPENGGWRVWGEQRTAAVSRREVLSQQAAHLLFYTQQEEDSLQASGSSRMRGKVTRGGSRDGRLDTGV